LVLFYKKEVNEKRLEKSQTTTLEEQQEEETQE
jgi:hypothetical protein